MAASSTATARQNLEAHRSIRTGEAGPGNVEQRTTTTLATHELTTREKAPAPRSRLRLRPAAAEGRRATTRVEELGALALGGAVGAVVGAGIVFLIAWLAF